MTPLPPSTTLFLSALCLTTAVFATRSQAATATQPEAFSGVYTTTTFTQYDGVALYGSTNGGNFTSLTLPVFTSVAANTSVNLGPATVQVPVGASNLHVAVCSVYGSPASSTVSLTLDSTYALSIVGGNSTAFSTAFGGTNEATIASYIQGAASGNSTAATALEGFFNTYSGDFPLVNSMNSATGTLVTFSNAAVGGSASLSLTPAPEPSTWALLGLGAAGLGLALRCRARAV